MNAAEHYHAAQELTAKLSLASSPVEAAQAISHALLALTGAVVLHDMGAYYAMPHGELVDAVIGRAKVVRP